jgi:hypothetical protein
MQKFKLTVSTKTGITTLMMASDNLSDSYIPIIGWNDIRGLKEFAEMLLEMYRNRQQEYYKIDRTSARLIEQALYDTQLMKGDANEE